MAEQQQLLPLASGDALRARRLTLGLSLQEVSAQIKCPLPVLEALEADQPVALAAVYVRGHIRRYCDLLGLDDERCAGILERHGNESPDVQTIYDTRPPMPRSDRWLRVASYVLASLLVGTLAWQVTHEAVRLTTSMDTRDAGPDAPAPEAESGAASHVNASIASLESLHAPAGSRTGNAGLQAWRAIEAARTMTPQNNDGAHRLVLETSADSWVEINGADGQLLEQDLLRGGERREYSDDGPFRVSLGRSSAVNLSLDGRPVDLAPYTRDDVARLLLDPVTLGLPNPASESGEPEQDPELSSAAGQAPEG